jgi:Lon protease-like protein
MPGPVLRYGLDDLPGTLPVFPLTGVLLLPRGRLPLNIFEPRYLAMIDDSLRSHRLIGMIQPLNDDHSDPPALRAVGCAGRIISFNESEDGRYIITLGGITRFRVGSELTAATPYRQVQPRFDEFAADLIPVKTSHESIDRPRLLQALRRYLDANKLKADWAGIENAEIEGLVNSLCMISPFGPTEKQALLEAPGLRDRADALTTLIEMALADHFGSPTQNVQ